MRMLCVESIDMLRCYHWLVEARKNTEISPSNQLCWGAIITVDSLLQDGCS